MLTFKFNCYVDCYEELIALCFSLNKLVSSTGSKNGKYPFFSS